MAITQLLEIPEGNDQQQEEELTQESKQLLISLPKERGWRTPNLYLFQGFWCQPKEIQATMSIQRNFKAQNSDIILASIPKSGTTWLKALAFAVINRRKFSLNNQHPLQTSNPHDLVPFLEYNFYANNQIPDLSQMTSPRLFATHMPFSALPSSVHRSDCRVVYICRNPFDTFVSIWHFLIKLRPEALGPFCFEEAFDMYCKGIIGFGPYWDHMLGFWKESLEKPHKVLFLKYEDMKEDIHYNLKRLAEFLGFPFSQDEEKEGVVDEVAKLCSFQKLKELDVNKYGKSIANIENKHLFRIGKVGDWVNHFTPEMVEQLSKVMEQNLSDSGLSFKFEGVM